MGRNRAREDGRRGRADNEMAMGSVLSSDALVMKADIIARDATGNFAGWC